MKFRPSLVTKLLQTISQPVFLLDAKATLLFCNRALEQWTGCRAEQLLGQQLLYRTSTSRQKHEIIAAALAPPPEVFQGRRCRFLLTVDRITSQSRRYADFVPLTPNGVLVLIDESETGSETTDTKTIHATGQPESAERQAAAELHQALFSFRRRQAGRFRWDRMIGLSPLMLRIRRLARLAADSTASVLIFGEAGTGKEHLASAIHYGQSGEQPGAFVPIECQVLDHDLIASTIYAFRKRFQREETSRRHTLFLKDAESLPESLYPLIADFVTTSSANQRIIATSIQPSNRWTNHESFPAVLGTIFIELPPLRNRKEDIPLLAQMFLEEQNKSANRQRGGFTSDALDDLTQYSWNGNIEELEQFVTEAHGRGTNVLITALDLPDRIRNLFDAVSQTPVDNKPIELEPFLWGVEKELIERALRIAGGNKSKASELLGITRPKLYRRMELLGLIAAESSE
jgi:transcriptional regulator with PAS, ATPase and Fis domain